jgi:hypothetical protein
MVPAQTGRKQGGLLSALIRSGRNRSARKDQSHSSEQLSEAFHLVSLYGWPSTHLILDRVQRRDNVPGVAKIERLSASVALLAEQSLQLAHKSGANGGYPRLRRSSEQRIPADEVVVGC